MRGRSPTASQKEGAGGLRPPAPLCGCHFCGFFGIWVQLSGIILYFFWNLNVPASWPVSEFVIWVEIILDFGLVGPKPIIWTFGYNFYGIELFSLNPPVSHPCPFMVLALLLIYNGIRCRDCFSSSWSSAVLTTF